MADVITGLEWLPGSGFEEVIKVGLQALDLKAN